jgi:Flp pilus assembly protein TadG
VLVPALVAVFLLVVASWRLHFSEIQVTAAADAAARAASLASRERIPAVAKKAAMAYLVAHSGPCTDVSTVTKLVDSGGMEFVRVEVACRLVTDGLRGLLRDRVIRSYSTEVIDVFSFR